MIGQLQGIDRMMDDGKDCKEVITQLKAVRSAVSSFMNRYMEDNALSCLDKKSSLKDEDREQIRKLIKQLTVNN
jgi:DNA-binding FrmR family transcriptional regulator